jgi:hypothetical protein
MVSAVFASAAHRPCHCNGACARYASRRAAKAPCTAFWALV